MNIVFIGLSITSSWGNGHATTYRGLIAALARRGHQVTFLERDTPWYAVNRDLQTAPYCTIGLYPLVSELKRRYNELVRNADVVVLGSYVPDGVAVGEWVVATARGVTAFYDIDTPVTVANVKAGRCSYMTDDLIARFDVYLSFTGGPFLSATQKEYHIPEVYALYCSADPASYFPSGKTQAYDLGYMGTYSPDRQPALAQLLIAPAKVWPQGRFVVAGPQYPDSLQWADNIARIDHVAPEDHRHFYNIQRFTLNLTRADMIQAGYCPSVRLFEAAACATPIISDAWPGLETLFVPGEEILISRSSEETLHWLRTTGEDVRRHMADRARQRVLSAHTPDHRAAELEKVVADLGRERKIAARDDRWYETLPLAGKSI
ncbi:MAG: glycosyltransferase [Desulfatitalea sp. BRH_c12]|nr:MAG: glycosyltransferase [Desulfatitalea sp. BRH_c12]